MAVSCLEQRLTPLTDAVPVYSPWGPLGVPPCLDEEAEEEQEPIMSLDTGVRRGRRCKTWAGYIPHALEGESPGGGSHANSSPAAGPGCGGFGLGELGAPEHGVTLDEAAWYGHEALDDYHRADQRAPAPFPGAEDEGGRYFVSAQLAAGARSASKGYGQSPDPAYVCSLASRGQLEQAQPLPFKGLDAAPLKEHGVSFRAPLAPFEQQGLDAAPLREHGVSFRAPPASFEQQGLDAAPFGDHGVSFRVPPAPFEQQGVPFGAPAAPFEQQGRFGTVGLPAPFRTPGAAAPPRADRWEADAVAMQGRQRGPPQGNTVTAGPPRTAGVAQVATQDSSVTTLMIQNLPRHISRREFLAEIDKWGFAGLYNFCHLPMSFDTGRNKGFAFVNFVSFDVAQSFISRFHDCFEFRNEPLDRALRIVTAEVQGFRANAAKAQSKKMRRVRNANFKPVLAALQ